MHPATLGLSEQRPTTETLDNFTLVLDPLKTNARPEVTCAGNLTSPPRLHAAQVGAGALARAGGLAYILITYPR